MFIILDFPFVLCLSRGAFCPASLLNIPPISFFAFQIEKSELRENVTKNRRFIKNSFDVLLFLRFKVEHQMTPNGKPSSKLKIPCANNTCGFAPHHRHKKETPPDKLVEFPFYMRYILRAPAVLFRLIPPLQGVFFAARIYSRSAARHFRKRPPVLPKGRTIPEKKASKPCSDHLFHRFLPILQCFL